MTKSRFQAAMDAVSEVMKFETWLRFYFIVEDGDEIVVRIPDGVLADMGEKHPHLKELAERYNGLAMDYETSRQEVCSFLGSRIEGVEMDMIPRVMDSRELRLEMHIFHLWVTGHEAVLDEEFTDFDWWKDNFARWRDSDEVQAFAKRMTAQETDAVPSGGCDTVQ